MIGAGIDKARLRTQSYVVKDLRGWTHKAGKVEGEEPPAWCRDDTGRIIEGTGFFLNTPIATFDLSPKGLSVTFNPSKVRHPWKLNTDPADVGRVGDEVQALLTRSGVLAEVDRMTLTRLDTAVDAQLSKPLPMYIPACSHLRARRMKSREYPDGYLWKNTQRASVLYSKTKEAAARKKDKGRVIIPYDVSRWENRWEDARPLARELGFSAFGDLRRIDPDHLRDIHRDALNRTVFHTDPKSVQYILDFDTEVELYAQYTQGRRSGMDRWIMDMGGPGHAVEALGGIDAVREIMRRAGDPERTIRDRIRRLQDHIRRAGFVQSRRDAAAVTVHTLIEELKTAFAA